MVYIIRRGASNINIKVKKTIITIITILLFMNIAFIWGNSVMSGEVSNAISDFIKNTIKDIVYSEDKSNVNDAALNITESGNTTISNNPNVLTKKNESNKSDNISYSVIIRKAAHFAEFMVLGMILISKKLFTGKPQLVTIAFVCLAIAVLDEFIQSFSDRTDSIKDVIIDFAGSLTGITLVFVIYIIVKNIKKVKKKI